MAGVRSCSRRWNVSSRRCRACAALRVRCGAHPGWPAAGGEASGPLLEETLLNMEGVALERVVAAVLWLLSRPAISCGGARLSEGRTGGGGAAADLAELRAPAGCVQRGVEAARFVRGMETGGLLRREGSPAVAALMARLCVAR